MIKELFETLRKPNANELAARELEEARRELLQSLSAREYAEGLVLYNTNRVNRLSVQVVNEGKIIAAAPAGAK